MRVDHKLGLNFWSAKSAVRRVVAEVESSLARTHSSAYAKCFKYKSEDVAPETRVITGSAVKCETETVFQIQNALV